MTFEALTDRDYQRLADTLARFSDQDCMNLEQLDGFFTALLCGPMPVKPTECLQIILGEAFDDEAAFPGNQALERFASLLMRHWLEIARTLKEELPFHPWLDADEHGVFRGNDWARGFVEGMQLDYDDWGPLLDDPAQAELLAPIMALAFEGQEDEDMQDYLREISPEQRADWLTAITPNIAAIHRHFARLRAELETGGED
ncbi:MAG: UPF0149 family protein [Paludibacterium sp.]|uniref:UPF0149 family protein n=1 Tax=Paludibacterium sp. TaxID=1917523 RepID=UPI0025EB2425|nr:UPF0149 family protein [Paludibacterium sp.]MBV8047124.1 UPF0149 family protein [Paludibacterium sp.]MBV8648745.1 UPF0149 family protein [Paludibacterium sp.]